MIIKVDIREQELFQKIKCLIETIPSFKNIKMMSESLSIGDVIIMNEKEEILIIERKSISDLMSSIKDGRYEEQSYRLTGISLPNHNIYYLIEGDVNKINRFKENHITEKLTLYSAIFSLNYTKGFSVMRTFSMDESAVFICNTANKLTKNEAENKKGYYCRNDFNKELDTNKADDTNTNETDKADNTNENTDAKLTEVQTSKDYISVVKRVKKENITVHNIDEIILCQIPGISSVTALAVIDKFKHIHNLINAILQDVDCLNDVTYTNSKGQIRKINKTCIENIKKYLLKMEC
jgi:ERCC4-type nuclease